ncbi:MAG: TIGR04086 family membrane protein [Clostridia bacterium]|nr:TIGR04086 family membrane protein [Clostridia bacterium]
MPVSPAYSLVKGLGCALIATVLAIVACGAMLKTTPISEKYLPFLALAVLIVGAGLGGFVAARTTGERGLVQGVAVGALYTIVIVVIALVIGPGNLDLTASLVRAGCSVFGGGIGGILGIASR